MQFKKLMVTALLTSGSLLIGTSVSAKTLDTSFNVKLAIAALCTVKTVDDVDFGLVDANSPTQTLNTELQIKCSRDEPYSVALKPSNNDANGAGQMKGATDGAFIAYNLYSDAAATLPWGTGAKAVSKTGDGKTQRLPVYVKVLNSELDKPADSYNDVVAIAINY